MEGIETRLKDYIHKRSRAQVFYGAKFAKLQGTHNSYASSTVTDGREKNAKCHNLLYKSGTQKWQRWQTDSVWKRKHSWKEMFRGAASWSVNMWPKDVR